ncbi:AI-2E family transporter [Afipia massiliensis]|uniref:AI-2E family transporter n=1 Tax=Afipia massiliensis TaxID=211460 RepID=A0A4V6BDQ9_9BRAD|nr:AI-2E family transporter [Afipia massiliensis]TKT70683.1 AI-2E family transporter [Afipia massiliensis]
MADVRREVRDRIRPAKPSPDEQDEQQPPAIGQAEIVSFSLIALLIISVVAVLYVARAFFLPTVTALVIGTMLSPAAKFFERFGIPRSVSAVLIVSATCAALAFMVALISAPVMEWTTRLPELGSSLKDKFHVFDRPIAFWHQLQALFGITTAPGESSLLLPKIEWVQPTLEFLSPTFTEILLFFAVLVLFIASWPDLRRALVLNFTGHDSRLRALRILNAIESNLGGYLLTVTLINMGLGIATGLICAATGMPNPAGLGALAATLNYIPIIGPIVMFVVLAAVGIITASTLSGGLVAAAAFAAVAFIEGHFITPMIIGRRLELNALAVFIAIAFWTWLWGPMGAFLSSPILIVGLVLKEHLMPVKDTQLPGD